MRTVRRRLYKGAEYEVAESDDNEASLRVWDVIGGDALVFLTPTRARRLISDLEPYARRRSKP